jgi:hypothetical protein
MLRQAGSASVALQSAAAHAFDRAGALVGRLTTSDVEAGRAQERILP